MKINWNQVAQSEGYKSLKAALFHSIKRKDRSKAELYKTFYWVINRAKHYSQHLNKPIEEILNEWETKRDCWWFGYYTEYKLPRLDLSLTVKPIKPIKYIKTDKWYRNNPIDRQKRIFARILEEQKSNSKRKGKKARWSKEQKERYKKYGK